MSILKYKYKAHRLINTLFYLILFLIGFVLGFTVQKIDLNKLINQFLMIDNVSAYTIYEDDNVIINEKFIYNKFIEFFGEEIDFNIYKNYIVSKQGNVFSIILLDDNVVNNFYINSQFSNNSRYMIGYYPTPDSIIYSFIYYPNLNSYYHQKFSTADGIDNITTIYRVDTDDYFSRTNFDLSFATDKENDLFNVLDFYNLGTDLDFNENLFKDNPDFKEVCVSPDTRFSITSNNITHNDEEIGLKYFNGIDFIWFSYVPNGLSTYLYSSAEDTKVYILTEKGPLFSGINPGKWYYLDNKSEIDKFFNTNPLNGEIYPGTTLEREGYIDKYSYFGWYFHPFVVHFDNTTDGNNYFNVFHFKDDYNFYSVLENGLDYYEELENARNGNICFYIKNNYDITILNKDIYDDDIGEITVLGGDKLNINTSLNSSSLNSKGLFSKINLFINQIKDNIDFINIYIYELYNSLPNIVQLFILSFFGLIVVGILIRMVVK